MPNVVLKLKKSDIDWLEERVWLPYGGTATMGGFIMHGTISALKQGQKEALLQLDSDERMAILAVTNGWLLAGDFILSGQMFAMELEDEIICDNLCMQGWAPEKISSFLQKLRSMNWEHAMGLWIWAKSYWNDSERNLDEYIAC